MRYIPAALFVFIVLSVLGVKFPSFISRYLFLIVNAIAAWALWPKVRAMF